MRRIYITFSGAVYDRTTQLIVERAANFGADGVWVYDDLWLTQQEFYKLNHWLWDHPHKRGFGWYAWKPFIILDALSRLEDGDIVLYTDADTYPVNNFSRLFDICERDGAMLFSVCSQTNRHWCKRDCYIVMGQSSESYADRAAGVARFALFQRGPWKPRQFLYEWLTYCVNPFATTFDASVLAPELPGFVEHRSEQAIMTLLAHRYGYKLYREADQNGNSCHEDRDLYGQLFCQDNDWRNETAPVGGSRFRSLAIT